MLNLSITYNLTKIIQNDRLEKAEQARLINSLKAASSPANSGKPYRAWIKLTTLLLLLILIAPAPVLAQAPTITLKDSGQRLGDSPTTVVELGDLDGDGDLDAVVGNDYPELAQVWLNNGAGIFTDTGQRFGQTAVRDIGLGDLNGDGALDIVLGSTYAFADTVYVNNGQGNFSLGQTLDAASTSALELGDVNNDGYLDAVILSYEQHKVWLNNGIGNALSPHPNPWAHGESM